MNFNFRDNKDFQALIKNKESEILDKTSDSIQESEGFKVMFASLKSMLAANAFNGSKIVRITESSILSASLDNIRDPNDLFSEDQFKFNQIIDVDSNLNIIRVKRERLPENSNQARLQFATMSRQGDVIFFLLGDKINYFIKGFDKSESIFFSLEDLNKYNEKREISRISEVFSIYQEQLKERHRYSKFFIELSHIKSLHADLNSQDPIKEFIKKYKHILRNKPEDTFRDDLRKFLTFNLKVTDVKEYLLENLKRLDIFLYDEFGEIYLVEVKWVGESVHPNGKKISTSFTENDITPAAFTQTLDYLQTLHDKGKNIIKAYLVVFDARKDDLPDTGTHFDNSILVGDQVIQYRKFEKTNDLRVVNFHPS